MTYPRDHKAALARLRAITVFARLVEAYPDLAGLSLSNLTFSPKRKAVVPAVKSTHDTPRSR